jgi:hypothetical protein
MLTHRSRFGLISAAWLLAGCALFSSTSDPVWSTLSEEDAVKNGSTRAITTAELANTIDRRPLVTIRFYRLNVPYEEALYIAVSRALERRPDVVFDLVAVAPQLDDPSQIALHSQASKRNAEDVFRSLTSMGVPAERVSLSATTNATAQSNEVRIYVR